VKQPQNEPIENGLHFLKVLIDAYHSNTRSSTTEVRRQMAYLDIYMEEVARGDISTESTRLQLSEIVLKPI
jgi:hypothetical protein